MSEIEIVQIDSSEYANTKLSYEYVTDSYYDISLAQEKNGWSAEVVLKPLECAITKRFEGSLFEPYVENPIAYRALHGGAEAGFMQLGFESWNKRLRVWQILVHASFRGKGIGAHFMEQAKADARKCGARMLILETQSCNVPAITFYRKHGFELIGFDLYAYSNTDPEQKEVRLEFGCRL